MKYLTLVALLGVAWSQRENAFEAQPPPGSALESNLRMHQIYETTSWEFLEDMYLYHNAIRYFHETSGLRFNRTLTDYARLKALILAWYDGDAPKEGGELRFGENTAWTPPSVNNSQVNASDIIEQWYFEEEPKWNYDDPHVSLETRDFSQMVWNSTVRFGCGQAVSEGPKQGTYTVCYYDPPGNVAGLEKANVAKPKYTSGSEEARRLVSKRNVEYADQVLGFPTFRK